jgi:transposase InsO family protein
MSLSLIDEAVAAGARLEAACRELGLSVRTVQRWRASGVGEDRRAGPRSAPANKLTEVERRRILKLLSSPEFCDLPPHQVVPRLADKGVYLASESTMYRLLREAKQLAHRQRSRPVRHQRPRSWTATGPCQVWSWDITYLPTTVKGQFLYLYMILDVWSRKIVGAAVFPEESSAHAAQLFEEACVREGVDPQGLVLHSDNGSPMKGATMLATLQSLGVVASFSRPRVSDDNPFSESLFRTLKYRPEYPENPFASLKEARAWVRGFVGWYNTEHLHSALRFIAPADRHNGLETEILACRQKVYETARRRRPERWCRHTRNWTPVGAVTLNPGSQERQVA